MTAWKTNQNFGKAREKSRGTSVRERYTDRFSTWLVVFILIGCWWKCVTLVTKPWSVGRYTLDIKQKNEKPKRFQASCVSFLTEIQSECVFQLFLFYSQAAMYKKSPPSEADCLLLALELLYVWRALYTCSETVLNRILTGKSFFCSAHYILRSLSVTWRKLSCVTYSVSQQKY